MKTKLALGFFLLAFFWGLKTDFVAAIEYGQLGGKPTYYDPAVADSQSWFIYNLEPGKSKEDSLTVMNLSEESWTALVYAADSIKSSGGGFALRQLTEPKEAVGSWVRFYPDSKPDFSAKIFEDKKTIDEVCRVSKEDLKDNYQLEEEEVTRLEEWCQGKDLVEVEMESGEKKDLLFVITIPQDADVGEHTGGIFIQKKVVEENSQADGSKVMLTTRVGVRIYETVPGEIIKKLDFSNFSIAKNFSEFYLPWDEEKKSKFGEYLINSSIKNNGNVSTDFSEKILIFNRLTRKTEVVEGRDFQVLRGDDFVSSLVWKGPRLGYYNFQKEYRYKNSAGEEQIIQSDSINKWFIPWRELSFFGFFLILVGIIFWVWKTYRRKLYGGEGWVDYAVQPGETVQTLSVKFKINWKALVKTNKLKAPYFLEGGEIIKVPKVEGLVENIEEKTASPKFEESEELLISREEAEEKEANENIIDLKKLEKDKENSTREEMKEIKNFQVSEPVVSPEESFRRQKLTENPESQADLVNSDLFFDDEEKINDAKEDVQAVKSEGGDKSEEKTISTEVKKSITQSLNKKPTEEGGFVLKEEADFSEKNLGDEDDVFIKGEKSDFKEKSNGLIYFLSVIIFVLAGVIIWFVWQNGGSFKFSGKSGIIAETPEVVSIETFEETKEAENNSQTEEIKAEEIDGTELEIKVYNASGVAGQAGKIKDFLTDKKYKKVEADNFSGEQQTGSTLYYKEEKFKQEALWIADILKDQKIEPEVKLASTDEEKSGDLVLVLGK
ncbi:MAG: LytR C-terminal domain-containing protein [Candidatus Moranbacteria bacterium]|jgi:LysM repeat protein|nr:LytR C-terminal domain-containing protein [Candidatus Moranbacteria bacterium]